MCASAQVAQFQFAPSNGAGMGSACAGTAVTGSKGETITFARATPRTCLKGNETTGIANTDMVALAANQPAVQSGGTGSLGLSVWGSRTNGLISSQTLNDANWTPFSSGGAAAPTVTANQATAPDGTVTAEEVSFPSTTASQRSLLFQANGCPLGQNSLSFFVKGKSGSGTLDIATDDASDGWLTRSCNYVATSWTRCLMEDFFVTDIGSMLATIGNMSSTNGGTARSANDVYVWGAQCEAGATASPYIPTTNDAGTRAADIASLSYTAAGSSISIGGTYLPTAATEDFSAVASVTFSAHNETSLDIIGAKNQCRINASDVQSWTFSPPNFLTPAVSTSSCDYAPTSRTACSGNQCMGDAGSITLATGAATIYIGSQFDGGTADGTVKAICVDSTASKCRPSGASPLTCPTDEPSTVAVVGDSIMVGVFTVKTLDEMQNKLCPSKSAVSFAVSGAKVADCVTQYHTNVKGHAYRAVATNCGINTLDNAGDVADTWAQEESFLNDIVRDGGFFLVLGNLTPCKSYSACGNGDPTKVAQVNAHIADWCADAGTGLAGARATCLDNYTLLGSASQTYTCVGCAGALGNQCLPSSDYLHPGNYCTTKLADAFAAAVP